MSGSWQQKKMQQLELDGRRWGVSPTAKWRPQLQAPSAREEGGGGAAASPREQRHPVSPAHGEEMGEVVGSGEDRGAAARRSYQERWPSPR
jgi:hypothetical protein